MLLVGAGLLTRSLMKLTRVDPGFNTENLLAVRVSIPRARALDSVAMRRFYLDGARKIAALPGVVSVTAGSTAPFSGGWSSSSFLKEGEVEGRGPNARRHEAQQRSVLPGYFASM